MQGFTSTSIFDRASVVAVSPWFRRVEQRSKDAEAGTHGIFL